MGAEVLTDDSLVVRRGTRGWEAVPGYPVIRLWPSGLTHIGWQADAGSAAAHYSDKHAVRLESVGARFADGPRPLSRLVLLGDGDTARPSAVNVYAQVFRLDVRDIAESTRLFHLVADLIGDLTVVRVDGPIDDRHAGDLASRLCNDAGCAW
jgi:hypothetical protein